MFAAHMDCSTYGDLNIAARSLIFFSSSSFFSSSYAAQEGRQHANLFEKSAASLVKWFAASASNEIVAFVLAFSRLSF